VDEVTSVAARRHFLRGVQHMQNRAPELAVAEFGLSLQHQENLFDAYRARAQAYAASGQDELAVADFSIVLERATGMSAVAKAAVLREKSDAQQRLDAATLAHGYSVSQALCQGGQRAAAADAETDASQDPDYFDEVERPSVSGAGIAQMGGNDSADDDDGVEGEVDDAEEVDDEDELDDGDEAYDEEDLDHVDAIQLARDVQVGNLRDRAKRAYYSGEYTESWRLLRELCTLGDVTAHDWRCYSHSQFEIGYFAGAASASNEALLLDSEDAWTWDMLGLAQEKLGAWVQAIEAFRKSRYLDPAFEDADRNLERVVRSAFKHAQTLREAKNFSDAAHFYWIVTLEKPDDGASWFYQGYCYERTGHYQEAIYPYERALSCGAWPAVTLNNLALVLRGLGRHWDANAARDAAAAAEPAIEQALGTQPLLPEDLAYLTGIADKVNLDQSGARTTPESQYLRGHALLRAYLSSRGRIDPDIAPIAEAWVIHAIGDFTAAIEHYGNSHAAYTRRGACWLIAGEYHKAVKDFSCTLDLWPDHELALRWRSVAHRAMKAWDLALSDMNRLFASGSGDCIDRLVRAELLINLGQFRAALGDLGACIDQGYRAELAYTLRATALTHMGWANAALADMRRAMALLEQRVRRETLARGTGGVGRPPKLSNSNREFDNTQDLEEEDNDRDDATDSDDGVESFILS
jgi:tetratricopeptide (TPR) repeat protein